MNSGQKPADTLLSLRYANGAKTYETQQTIQPGDQMWVNLASLIRDRVPDRKGNLLPADLASGTYDVQQIGPAAHSLLLGSLAVDQTWGYQIAPPYDTCCSYGSMGWVPDSIVLDPEGIAVTDIDATDSCTNGSVTNLSSDFGIWSSGNTSVAVVTKQKVQAVGVGTTTGTAQGGVFEGVGGYCAFVPEDVKVPIAVQPQITSFDPNPIMIGTSSGTLTINGSGFGSSPTVSLPSGITSTGLGSTGNQIVLTGVSVSFSAKIGSNNVTVTANAVPSAPASLGVNGPSEMVVQNDSFGSCSGVSYQCRIVSYTVKNYDGTLAANIPIAENISFSGYNCQQSNPGNESAQCNAQYATDGGGNFSDQWAMYTGFTPAGCGQNITDHWQWCGPTGNNPNPGITFGSLIGWSHTASVDINGYINPGNPANPIPAGTVFSP